jgi:hypothetical protein
VKNNNVVLETFSPDRDQFRQLSDFVFDQLPTLSQSGELVYPQNLSVPDQNLISLEVIALAPFKHRRPYAPAVDAVATVWAQLTGETLIRGGHTTQRRHTHMRVGAGQTVGIYGNARRSFENPTKFPALGVLLRIME